MGLVCARIQTMGRLIDDLLAFSKLGRQAMVKSAVSMAEVVRSSIEAVENQGQGRRIPPSPEVITPSDRLDFA